MADETTKPKIHISEVLLHCAVRLQCPTTDGKVSVGTGHYFQFEVDADDALFVPAIITNRHVVKDAVNAMIRLTPSGADGLPNYGTTIDTEWTIFTDKIIGHPDDEVDLVAIPCNSLFQNYNKFVGAEPFRRSVGPAMIADSEYLEGLRAIEDATMVGYPQGIWDEKNNLPIVRRGITATPPWIDYEGKSEFMIDMPVFHGSSGSPVFLFNEGGYAPRFGPTQLGGNRFKLLGVLWGGPTYTAEGKIIARPIPTKLEPVAEVNLFMNLGYCIKAERILDFQPLIEDVARRGPSE